MIVEPKIRGFICTTAHAEGCRAETEAQIEYVKSHKSGKNGPKKVLVIGASMGYGLASRIAAAYSFDAATIGVIFDKPAMRSRTATSGWYNTAAFESAAHRDGLYAKTINGDAYSKEIKDKTIELIKTDLGKVDCVIYSLAAPRRTTADGTVYSSVLKTVGKSYTNKTINLKDNTVSDITVEPATQEEIEATVKVMGGEDWKDWIDALKAADAIEDNAVTVAYSYIGPEITHPMYADGSIGKAKDHLFETSKKLTESGCVRAYISVNKALVTQSSAAIPIVPLYISILYKVMKENNVHEGCIEQMTRLLNEKLYGKDGVVTDSKGRIRMDDLEMQPEIQEQVNNLWAEINSDNLDTHADLKGYTEDFLKLFGFGIDGVDYDADIDPDVKIPSVD